MLTRRKFIRQSMITGSVVAVAQSSSLGWAAPLAARKRALLPDPKFYWGVGIENCWIAQVNPKKDGNRRLLDVFLQMQHYTRWREDLQLVRDLGVNCIRYSVPWYKAEPHPGKYDWSWIDGPIDYLVNKLNIIPVMDLVHYGTPAWMEDGVIDERYPESLAAYAGAMASHFKGLVNHYSPQNEPGVTCLFCGLNGRWPPYHKSIESWSKIGIRVAKAMVLETRAIREAIADARIVSVDPFFFGAINAWLPKDIDSNPELAELRNAAASYPASVAYGKVGPSHVFGEFLLKHGVAAHDLQWVHENAEKPDIYGYNNYPDGKDGDYTRHGKVPLAQAAREAANAIEEGIRRAHRYFGIPVYLTETSAGLTTEAKVAFIDALYDMTLRLRKDGVPFRGINWWPLFETIRWEYREEPEKPLSSFIRPGEWNNGLYVTDAASPNLKRVHTAAADAYSAIIKRDARGWKTASASD